MHLVHEFNENLDVVVEPGQQRTAFHVLAELRPQSRINTVVAAVAKELFCQPTFKSHLNSTSTKGTTALWHAAKNMNYDLFDCLLGAGADPTIANGEGISPLDVVRKLVKHTRKFHADAAEGKVAEPFVKLLQSSGYAVDDTA